MKMEVILVRRYLKWFAVLVILMLPASGFCGGGAKEEKGVHPPSSGIQEIKKVKQPEPNIPAEYKGLVELYNKYWDHIMKKEYAKAYAMENSDYRKANPYADGKSYNEMLSKNEMMAKNLKITAVKALEVEKVNEKEVIVKGHYYFHYVPQESLKSVKQFHDRWVKEKDGWGHILKEK